MYGEEYINKTKDNNLKPFPKPIFQ